MSKKSSRGHTPMMEQYLRIKAEHPDAILMFRMGDFYETFFDDAKTCAAILGITLTAREKKGGSPIPLAGVPHHALEHYLVKLMDAGCTVAICDQMEDPSQTKGLVRREVVEVLSPGTVTNPALLRDDDNAFLLALTAGDQASWGYALLDGSTGEFRCGESARDEALSLPRRYRVHEVLMPESCFDASELKQGAAELRGVATTPISSLLFELGFAGECLRDQFGVQGLEGLGLDDLPDATRAAGAALRYLADRQRSRPDQVARLVVDRPGDRLHLDRETVGHLELFESLRAGDRESTLFYQINSTRTPMGRRCLAAWLRAPLCDGPAIEARLDVVQHLLENPIDLQALRDSLRGIGDLERIAGRIATARVMPHELSALRAGLGRVPELAELITDEAPVRLGDIRAALAPASTIAAPVVRELVESPPTHLRNGGIFVQGVSAELDEVLALASGGKQWLANYQQEQRERSGITSLKVSYNKVFGYYLEITRAHLDKVPEDYEEKQTLANGKRYVTRALKERERQILGAQDRRIALEASLFQDLVKRMGDTHTELVRVHRALGVLDSFASLAALARARSYVRPEIESEDVLDIEGGRHPVVERLVGEPFVPNDLLMRRDERQILLLTGPNMGGKSTYLRQAALFVVLAQMGSFVPAIRARVGIVDRLFTRVGASDNLARGQSTFLVEMAETANILRNATDRSLVILDEVGRGTSTDDGLALAWAITEYLHDGPLRPKTLFATHFHQLTGLVEDLPRAANIQMDVRDWEGEILFLHKVVPGASDRSYGVHVAELAGVPRAVLERANEIMDRRDKQPEIPLNPPRAAAEPQLELFGGAEREVLDRLRAIQPDALRPLDALQLLAELRDRLNGTSS